MLLKLAHLRSWRQLVLISAHEAAVMKPVGLAADLVTLQWVWTEEVQKQQASKHFVALKKGSDGPKLSLMQTVGLKEPNKVCWEKND